MSKPYVNPDGKLVTMLVGGVETAYAPDVAGAKYYETDQLTEQPCSFTARGIEPYRAAVAVGPDGIMKNLSVTDALQGGSFDDKGATGVKVQSTSDNFTALLAIGGKYVVKDSEIVLDTKADGKYVCDFSGYGAAVTAMEGSDIVLDNVNIKTVGVAKLALFADSRSHCLFKDCDVEVCGGFLYDGYVNSADQKTMVAPPWVLGIGGNARGINLMGDRGAATLVNTDFKANQWGVLSTDSGTNMQLYVIDSKMTLMGKNVPQSDTLDPYSTNYGSGYGTYIIGNAHEEFFGADIKVGTYTAILRGGKATYQSSKGLMKVVSPVTGETVYEGQGKGVPTKIYSDAFGWMAHGDGVLSVIDGTEVECADALFLLKSNGVTMNLDNCKINNKKGVLVQMIDDDDSIVGADFSGGAPAFKTDFFEKAGWPSENGQISSKMPKAPAGGPGGMPGGPGGPGGGPGGSGGMPEGPGGGMKEPDKDYPTDVTTFNATNVALKGDIFNGTGYFGQNAKPLVVNIGKGAVVDGAISATEIQHINEKGEQNTHFTIKEFYYLGHVANRSFFNGDNKVEVVLHDGGVWNVTGEGVITALTVGAGCTFNGKAFMDGKEIAVEVGKKYEGIITISK